MCGSCQAAFDAYMKLAEQYRNAAENAKTARDDAIKIQSDFSNVIINGSPVGNEELNNCITNFTGTISRLQTSYQRCITLANSIRCFHLQEED